MNIFVHIGNLCVLFVLLALVSPGGVQGNYWVIEGEKVQSLDNPEE